MDSNPICCPFCGNPDIKTQMAVLAKELATAAISQTAAELIRQALNEAVARVEAEALVVVHAGKTSVEQWR